MFVWSKSDIVVLPIALLAIIAITVLLWFLLNKKTEKIRKIPLVVITCLMLLLELIKQIKAIINGYDYYTLPLHFCSLFIYFFPLSVFTKGKLQQFGKTMSFVCSLWLFLLFYVNPDSIIGNATQNIFASFGTFHTFFYHHLAMMYLPVGLSLKLLNLYKESLIHVMIGLTIYSGVAVPVAYLTGANFCNILVSNISFMESLRQSAGQVVYTLVLFMIGLIGGMFACFVNFMLNLLSYKLKRKKCLDKRNRLTKEQL